MGRAKKNKSIFGAYENSKSADPPTKPHNQAPRL